MKKCKYCLEYKGFDQFNKNSKSADRLCYGCRPCEAKITKEWKLKNKHKKPEWNKKYNEKYPEKKIAGNRLMAALRNGSMKRGDVCFDCGKQTLDTVGDHYLGYAKEHWLDVQWICKPCDGRRRAKILELTGGKRQSVA